MEIKKLDDGSNKFVLDNCFYVQKVRNYIDAIIGSISRLAVLAVYWRIYNNVTNYISVTYPLNRQTATPARILSHSLIKKFFAKYSYIIHINLFNVYAKLTFWRCIRIYWRGWRGGGIWLNLLSIRNNNSANTPPTPPNYIQNKFFFHFLIIL